MATVFVPAQIRDLTGGADQVEVKFGTGKTGTVRELVAKLEKDFPGVEGRLLEDGALVPTLAVFIDGEPAGLGLGAKVREEDTVFFLAPIVGG